MTSASKTSPVSKYDIAISFCREDEDLALEIVDSLSGLSAFVYSKKQEEIAGTDGLEKFRDVFRNQCELALILHRDKWGTTPWTRVEETAIKDMCLQEGWTHLLFVKGPKSETIPNWVPDTHLYLDLTSYSTEELVGVIKSRLQELGCKISPLSTVGKAKNIAERHAFNKETENLLRSTNGVRQTHDFINMVLEEIRASVQQICEAGIPIILGGGPNAFVMRSGQFSVRLIWQPYGNSTIDNPVQLDSFKGVILTPEESRAGRFVWDKPSQRGSRSYDIWRTRSLGVCLRSSNGECLSSKSAAEKFLEWFLDQFDQIQQEKPDFL